MSRPPALTALAAFLLAASVHSATAQEVVEQGRVAVDPASYVPDLGALMTGTGVGLAGVVERFTSDRNVLQRRYAVSTSPVRQEVMREFYTTWLARLRDLPFATLDREAQVDLALLRNRIEREQAELQRTDRLMADLQPVMPFVEVIYALEEERRTMATIDPSAIARKLSGLADEIIRTQDAIASATTDNGGSGMLVPPTRILAFRAAEFLGDLRSTLNGWYDFYNLYDPLFTWWVGQPYQRADSALNGYRQYLRQRIVGIKPGEEDPIVGLPIGRQAILEDLRFEMIPYTPEELVQIAEREFAWCEAEMRRASREMGYGDDWRAALEHVKTLYVDPGKQTDLVRDLAFEAERFLDAHDLVTVPTLARDVWRMNMMSPERQRVAPFFLGGEVVQVSYPTTDMSEADKMMSLRGNNVHFSRAVVFHELIPGHHLQGFMSSRYFPYRNAFSTPFWGEGNALYWEMLLWDMNFQGSPEDRIGALFWRSHRAARIIFSLGFHLGTMTPEEAIEFLVQRVGHERANAEGEVRRSFNGSYSPLYQIAYMIGGLQFRALHRELVGSGQMTNREYHDAILRGGRMPVEMVRVRLTNQPLQRDYRASWRFYPLQ